MLHHLMWLSLLALIFGTIADATNNVSKLIATCIYVTKNQTKTNQNKIT